MPRFSLVAFIVHAVLTIMAEIASAKKTISLDYAQSHILNPGEEPPYDPLDFESDIREREISNERNKNALRDTRALWRTKTIPYVFNSHLGSRARQAVMDAILDYDTYTCIRFVPRDPKRHSDFVEFIRDKGCYSYVGRNGGRQTLSLGDGCEVKGIAIHEMMHVVGFMHEQSRSDRDNFVTILYQNIPRKLWDQFDKMKARQENNLGAKYDYNSVMHYSRKAFTANGRDTILPKIDGVSIGQRRGFSTVDVHKINHLYGCTDVVAYTETPAINAFSKSVHETPPSPHSHLTTSSFVTPAVEHLSTRWMSTATGSADNSTQTTSITDQIDNIESGELIEANTESPSVAINTACMNRKNRLYCDMKRNAGWCRKSPTVAFEHCPLTCGTCGWRHGGPTKAPLPPEEESRVGPMEGRNNGTESGLINEECKDESCCDKWKKCFEFHCVLYNKFCAKTCGICK